MYREVGLALGPIPFFPPSLISLTVSVDVKQLDKHIFKKSRQNKYHICRDKSKLVATKMMLVAAPADDAVEVIAWAEWMPGEVPDLASGIMQESIKRPSLNA